MHFLVHRLKISIKNINQTFLISSVSYQKQVGAMIIEEVGQDDYLQDAQESIPQGMTYLYMPSVYSNGNYKIPNQPVLDWLAKQQQQQHQDSPTQTLQHLKDNNEKVPEKNTTEQNEKDEKQNSTQETPQFVPPPPPPPVKRVPKQQQSKEKPTFMTNKDHIKNAIQNFKDKKELQETKADNTWNKDTLSTSNWKPKEKAWTPDNQWEQTKDDNQKKKWEQTQWKTATKEHNWKPDNQQQAWKNTDTTKEHNWKPDDQQQAWKDTDTSKEKKWKQTEWHQNEPVKKPVDNHNTVPEPTNIPKPPPPQRKQNVEDKYIRRCTETDDVNLWQPPPYEEDGDNFSQGEKRDLIPQNLWCTACWNGVYDYNMDTHVISKKHLKAVAAIEDNKHKTADQKPVVNIPKLFVPPQQFKLPTTLEQETKPQQSKKKRSKKHHRQSSTSSSESTTSAKKKTTKKKKKTHELATQSNKPPNMQQQYTNTIPVAPIFPNYAYMQQPQPQGQQAMQPNVWQIPQVQQIGQSMYSSVSSLQPNPQRPTTASEQPLFGI